MATTIPVDELETDEIEAFQEELLKAATGTLNLFTTHLATAWTTTRRWPKTAR